MLGATNADAAASGRVDGVAVITHGMARRLLNRRRAQHRARCRSALRIAGAQPRDADSTPAPGAAAAARRKPLNLQPRLQAGAQDGDLVDAGRCQRVGDQRAGRGRAPCRQPSLVGQHRGRARRSARRAPASARCWSVGRARRCGRSPLATFTVKYGAPADVARLHVAVAVGIGKFQMHRRWYLVRPSACAINASRTALEHHACVGHGRDPGQVDYGQRHRRFSSHWPKSQRLHPDHACPGRHGTGPSGVAVSSER